MTTKKLSALEKLSRRAEPVATREGKAVEIPLEKIRFDATQPRQDFHHPDGRVGEEEQARLEEMRQSIETQGLIQPITVEALGDGTYRVVVGERRTRAHLLLGRSSILAFVKDDLVKPKKRLIYQLAENVNRADLSDADMAKSVRRLMEGEGEDPPMTQAMIAAELGKSEGWVSRYVKFGDDEQRRIWVDPGIADTVEKLYRLSILPMPVQAEIQRRVQLPEDHPDHLAKPLNRDIIDTFAKEARAAKKAAQAAPAPAAAPTPAPASDENSADGEETTDAPAAASASSTVATDRRGVATDPMSQALADMAEEGRGARQQAQNKPATLPGGSGGAGPGTGYTLSTEDRAKILSAASVTAQGTQKSPSLPPVTVRVPMGSLQALLPKLEPADRESIVAMHVSVNLPGPLAERIANALAGVVVDARDVPAVVQNELVKLN
jgi:ParB family chromosome partitioning protein